MKHLTFVTVSAALIAFLSPHTASAQEWTSGTWSIHPSVSANSVQVELRSRHDPAQKWDDQMSDTLRVERLGLTAAQIAGASVARAFAVRSDAGEIDFNGVVGDGVGAGHFTFHPNAAYETELTRRGIDKAQGHKLLSATFVDLTFSYIDAMAAAGYPTKSFNELMSMRALDISPESARRLRAAFGDLNERELVEVTAMHVTPEYAASLRGAGIPDLDVRGLVEMKAMGVDAQYVRSVRADFPGITRREIIELKALHIDSNYIQELASAGYAHLGVHDLVELKALHIDKAYIQRLEAHGLKHLTTHQLVNLKASGV